MRIGIVGTGNMGRAIGVRLAHVGHHVLFGARTRQVAVGAAELAGENADSGTVDDAARHGELLFWTVRETDVSRVLSDSSLLEGKIVVDINNRDYENELLAGSPFNRSLAERLQAGAPRTHVVKALNVVAMETLDASPDALRRAGAQVFIAGDDSDAKQKVGALLEQLGFETIDLGSGPVALRAAEALGDVVRLLMIRQGLGTRANLQLRFLPEPDLAAIGARAASKYT